MWSKVGLVGWVLAMVGLSLWLWLVDGRTGDGLVVAVVGMVITLLWEEL